MNKVFPIDNGAACQFKWTWSTIFLNRGTTASCHRGAHWDLDENTIMNFHNLPQKIGDREKMLKGIWPGNGCEYCRDVEAAGGISERLSYVNNFDGILPPELETDMTATNVTPRLLEVYFSNICNQSCVYCSPGFSSQIEQEVRKYGPSKYNDSYSIWNSDRRDMYEVYLAKFWEWMKLNATELRIFQVLGGEPLYQDEFEQCLDFFENNPCPDLIWRVFTNMNHNPTKFKEKINRIQQLIDNKKIKSMDFVCSIDCWGPEVEYARYGLNLEECEENMNTILNANGIGILIHSTLSALTVPTLYQLCEKVMEWKQHKKIIFGWNTVVRPECFDVYHFGHHLAPYIDKALEVFEKNGGLQDYQKYLLGIKQRMIETPINIEGIDNLVGFLDDLDIRRNDDWKSRFPQITQLIQEIKK